MFVKKNAKHTRKQLDINHAKRALSSRTTLKARRFERDDAFLLRFF